MLAAKALEDSRIGISPLEKSTRYVRFDRAGPDGRYLYHRSEELANPLYEKTADALFETYSRLIEPATLAIRERYAQEPGETDRAWKSATRAKALDLLRGLLPAGALTNLGLFGNGRSFEYLITKLSAHELPECRRLAADLHQELSLVIPAFVRRAIDERYGRPAAEHMTKLREHFKGIAAQSPSPLAGEGRGGGAEPAVRLIEYDSDAEKKVVAAALFSQSNLPIDEQGADPEVVLEALLGDRANRRQRPPRALEHAHYDFARSVEGAAGAHGKLEQELGPALAQYAVPMAFHVRWYFHANLREVYHLCELRTTPQGHPDYRWVAQEMFRRVAEVHPRLAGYARFVDLGPGDELERRRSEQKIDAKLSALDRRVR